MGRLQGNGDPCFHQVRVQLGLPGAPLFAGTFKNIKQKTKPWLALRKTISQGNTKSGLGLSPFLPGLCSTIPAVWEKSCCHLVRPATSTLPAEHGHAHHTACAHAAWRLRPAQEPRGVLGIAWASLAIHRGHLLPSLEALAVFLNSHCAAFCPKP